MKKQSIFLAALCFIVPAISFASIDINLKYGAQGTEVKELQEFLIDKGFLTGQATGNFFTLTKKAVIAYQTSVDLPATGFVGPMTREKINPELVVDTTAEVQETGTVTPPTKKDTATALQNQIDALLTQLRQLNDKVKTQTSVQQQTQTTLEQTQTTLQQTQQSVQQIQQNTTPIVVTPPPAPAPVPPPEVKKEFLIVGPFDNPTTLEKGVYRNGAYCVSNYTGFPYESSKVPQCSFTIFYTENGEKKDGVPITISSDDGYFYTIYDNTRIKGNPLTAVSIKGSTSGECTILRDYEHPNCVSFQYVPTSKDVVTRTTGQNEVSDFITRTITVSAMGISRTATFYTRFGEWSRLASTTPQ